MKRIIAFLFYKVTISVDYDWKYGEPSIYGDEMIWYLSIDIDGECIDDIYLHQDIFAWLRLDYDETLKECRINGPITRRIFKYGLDRKYLANKLNL